MCDEKPSNLKLYRSSVTGQLLSLREARLAVLAEDDSPQRPAFRGSIRIADLADAHDHQAVTAINEFYWGCLDQDVFGRNYNVLDCENLLALPLPDELAAADPSCHGIAGNVAITEEEGFLHIVVFNVWPAWHGRGVGGRLLEETIRQARLRGFPCIKLGTTNDNLPALYFYQRAGFVIEQVVPEVVALEHGLAPGGFAGIPVRDEFRLRLDLQG